MRRPSPHDSRGEPSTSPPEATAGADADLEWHAGPRDPLRPLFALAEDSPPRLEASIGLGRVLVAGEGGVPVGLLQLVACATPDEVEVRTLAVAEGRRRRGLGRALVERAVAVCRDEGARTLLVATAAADTGALRFYQRLGFRLLRVERDAFTPAHGYPGGLRIDGIPLRDRVWLSLPLGETA